MKSREKCIFILFPFFLVCLVLFFAFETNQIQWRSILFEITPKEPPAKGLEMTHTVVTAHPDIADDTAVLQGKTKTDSKEIDDCDIFTPFNITYSDITEDVPCNAQFCPTIEGNIRKIQSYNFSKAEPYFKQLEPGGTQEAVYNGKGTSKIEIPVLVGGASSNHFHEAIGLLQNLNEVVRPAYPSIKVFYYDLGLRPEQHTEIQRVCNCTVIIFPFDKFPSHVKELHGYSWKPLVVKIVMQTYRFVLWMDTSTRFKTYHLDPLFLKAKQLGVMARRDKHSLSSHTHEDTSIFLKEPPCLYKNLPEIQSGLVFFHSGNKIAYDNIFTPWVKCALIEECMKTKHPTGGKMLYCKSHKIYHACHRYDQTILSLLMYRMYNSTIMNYHIDLTYNHFGYDFENKTIEKT